MSNPEELFDASSQALLNAVGQLGPGGALEGQDYTLLSTDDPHRYPSPEPGFAADGEEAHDILEQFDAEFRGWEPDSIIRTTFSAVDRDSGNVTLSVSEAVIPDIRRTTNFALEPGEKVEQLQSVGIADVFADVRIQGCGEPVTTAITLYPAMLEEIYDIQQPFDGNFDALQEGDNVLVEGIVSSYEPTDDTYSNGHITITLPSGQSVVVDLFYGTVRTRYGSLELIYPAHPHPGDRIQLQTTWRYPSERRQTEDQSLRLVAQRSLGLYIREPGVERLTTYNQDRQTMATELAALRAEQDMLAKRRVFSRILHRYENITPSERTALWEAMETGEPNDTMLPSDGVTTALRQELESNVDYLAMSRGEFAEHVRALPPQLFESESKQSTREVVGLLRDSFEDDMALLPILEDIIQNSVATLDTWGELKGWKFGHERFQGIAQLADCAIEMLRYVRHPQAIAVLARAIDLIGPRPAAQVMTFRGTIHTTVMDTLGSQLRKQLSTIDGYPVAVQDEQNFKRAAALVPKVVQWFPNGGDIQEELRKLTKLVELFGRNNTN